MGRKQSGFAKRIRHEFDIEMQLYVNNRNEESNGYEARQQQQINAENRNTA